MSSYATPRRRSWFPWAEDEGPNPVNSEPPLELRQLDLDETSPTSFFTNIWRYRGTVRVQCVVGSTPLAARRYRLQSFSSTYAAAIHHGSVWATQVLTGLRMPMACSVLLSASVAVAHDLSRLQGFDSTLEGVLGACSVCVFMCTC